MTKNILHRIKMPLCAKKNEVGVSCIRKINGLGKTEAGSQAVILRDV